MWRRCRGVLALMALLQEVSARTFVLSRAGDASTSSSGQTTIPVELSAAAFDLQDASQSLTPAVWNSVVAGAEWTLGNWSQPIAELMANQSANQSVELDVQLTDAGDKATVTKLLLQKDEQLTDVQLSLVFHSAALAGLSGLSQVHVQGLETSFQDSGWLPKSADMNQLIFDDAAVDSFALENTVTIQQVVMRRSNVTFPTAVLGLDTAITTLILEYNTIAGPIQLTQDEYAQLANISDLRATGNTIDSSNNGSASCLKEETVGELAICIVSDTQMQDTTPSTASSESGSQKDGSVATQSTSESSAKSSLSVVAIILGCSATVVFVIVGSFFRRFKKKANKFVEDRLTFGNHEDALLTGRHSTETTSRRSSTGEAKILTDMDLGKDKFSVHKKLGVQRLWLGEYQDTKVVALRFTPRELNLSANDFNAIRLSYPPLKHENIVHFLGSTWNDREEIFLLVEHMSKGSLRSVLADNETELAWPQRIQMCKDICSGLNFLRSLQGVKLSQNLTAKSVLVNNHFTCKLDIFDYASSLRTDLEPVRSYGHGDIASRAPELLKGDELTAAAEVYALGVIFCEISSRSKVFEHVSEERGSTLADIFIATEVVAKRLKPSPTQDAPAEFSELTLRCLAYEPAARPNVHEVLKALSK